MPGAEKLDLLILYGSETGTAEEVAEKIWKQSKQRGLESKVSAMDDYDITDLINEKAVVFVVATAGQGEPPRNMIKSWNFLLRKSLPNNSLVKTWVAVLGLGDSSYVKFNFVAKKLNKRLTGGLGAMALCSPGLADDQHELGSSAVVDPWVESLWASLKENIYPDLELSILSVPLVYRWSSEIVSDSQEPLAEITRIPEPKDRVYHVSLSSNSRVTDASHFQDVRLICFRSQNSKFKYEPGDVAVVIPENPHESVDKFFNVFEGQPSIEPNVVVRLNALHKGMPLPDSLTKSFTLRDCATKYWDLNAVPGRTVFEALRDVTTSDLEKEKLTEMCSPQGEQELYSYCNRPRRTVVEVLGDFPHATPRLSLDRLFDILRPIRPRAFSIASSPAENELKLLVAVVRYKTIVKAPRLGLCSNWLAQLETGAKLQLAIRKGSLKFPPSDSSIGAVMVGPGTGVAPFRSYIYNDWLRTDPAPPKRPLVLFFGCRNRSNDFFFELDWKKICDDTRQIFTAFSRDQDHKIYVQHLIEKENRLIAELILNKGCWFFVAGNSKDMPQAVRQALAKCLVEHSEMNDAEVEQFIVQMELKGRYQTETWS